MDVPKIRAGFVGFGEVNSPRALIEQKCARACPPRAIPHGERSFEPVNECGHRGVLQWQLDHKKCSQYCAEAGVNCGICLRTCPFNKDKGKVQDLVRWFIKNIRVADPLFIKLDDALGYGKYVSSKKMWKTNKQHKVPS